MKTKLSKFIGYNQGEFPYEFIHVTNDHVIAANSTVLALVDSKAILEDPLTEDQFQWCIGRMFPPEVWDVIVTGQWSFDDNDPEKNEIIVFNGSMEKTYHWEVCEDEKENSAYMEKIRKALHFYSKHKGSNSGLRWVKPVKIKFSHYTAIFNAFPSIVDDVEKQTFLYKKPGKVEPGVLATYFEPNTSPFFVALFTTLDNEQGELFPNDYIVERLMDF